jgi:hypothetical protein
MLINQLIEQSTTLRVPRPSYDDVNRLLAAAVVSCEFCNILLNDPGRAIQEGFAGEQFTLSADEYELVTAIRSSSLTDFAGQLCKALPGLYTPFEASRSNYIGTGSWPM